MQTVEPQAILTPITGAAIFLTLTVDEGAEDQVRDLLSDVSGLRRSVGFRIPEAGLMCVVGLGSAAWDRLFGPPRPAGLHPFEQMLENMFVGKPPGNSDRILDFSTALTGNLFFVPTVQFLDDPPVPAR